jgi:hypothetical protein
MASNLFQHTDSLFNPVQDPRESSDAALDLELLQTHHDDDNHARENTLVGVVSDNPFASDARSTSHGDGINVDSEAAEPRDRTDTDPAVHLSSHKESNSSSADHNTIPDTVGPLDTDNVDPLDTSLSGGSHINHGCVKPGTEISIGPQSSTEKSESRHHDDSKKLAEETPRIAFATSDHIDSASKSDLHDPHAIIRRDTTSNGHDFSGKIVLSRNNSVVSMEAK